MYQLNRRCNTFTSLVQLCAVEDLARHDHSAQVGYCHQVAGNHLADGWFELDGIVQIVMVS